MKQLTFKEFFMKPEFPAVPFQKTEKSTDIHPFWNPSVKDISEILWLPPFCFSGDLPDYTSKTCSVCGKPVGWGE